MCISKLSRGFVNAHASAMKRFSYTTSAYSSDLSERRPAGEQNAADRPRVGQGLSRRSLWRLDVVRQTLDFFRPDRVRNDHGLHEMALGTFESSFFRTVGARGDAR